MKKISSKMEENDLNQMISLLSSGRNANCFSLKRLLKLRGSQCILNGLSGKTFSDRRKGVEEMEQVLDEGYISVKVVTLSGTRLERVHKDDFVRAFRQNV